VRLADQLFLGIAADFDEIVIDMVMTPSDRSRNDVDVFADGNFLLGHWQIGTHSILQTNYYYSIPEHARNESNKASL